MSMIRKLGSDITFDDAEDEVFFTCAALKADPDAVDLLPFTADWMSMVDAARAKERQARVAAVDATALRVIANHQLDHVCTAFADELYLAVGKDRDSSRWRGSSPWWPAALSGCASTSRCRRSRAGWCRAWTIRCSTGIAAR